MPSNKKVFVFAEPAVDGGLTKLTLELMGLGAGLASGLGGELEAVLPGDSVSAAAQELATLGARRVHAADHPSLREYNPDTYLEVLEKLLREESSFTLLAGHTPVGQDLMPRLAFALEAGLVTDCVAIEQGLPGEGPVFTKPVFGGNALASHVIRTPRRMATVRARVGTAPEPAASGGEVVSLDAPAGEPLVKSLGRTTEDRGVKLEDCRVVVAGGRGMGGAEGFQALEELAALLGGAVGASRPPCDSGWIPSSSQVGITGTIVAPDIYFAVAISGSSQHLSGMSESGKIIAINQDPEAYIFKVSDYGAVGDWKQVLPALTDELKRLCT